MLGIERAASGRPTTILALGAHCDDIEIGCAATLSRCVAANADAQFIWVTFSSNHERAAETQQAAARILRGARDVSIRVEGFEESNFPSHLAQIKRYFEGLKARDPDIIFTHYRADLHQDHRVVCDLTWNTFRNHLILEYEVPKYDGDFGVPNAFVPITRHDISEKCDMLMECFTSQRSRTWFTPSTFEAVARLRGIECNAPAGYAEAFYCRKFSLTL
jgi:LmbE family N-acetylglucosaminyl deacetylase